MKSEKIIIFGSSGHARSIAEILERLDYEIVGLIVKKTMERIKLLLESEIFKEERKLLKKSEKLILI
jgi:hypothetical protein